MAARNPETILFFAANPRKLPKLGIEEEIRDIQNGLLHTRDYLDFRSFPAARPHDLQVALQAYRPAYVHFSGHGAGEPGIILEGGMVSGETLAALFKLFPEVRCVLLNACYSAEQAEAIVQHVDYVVAMENVISDSAALAFSKAFYQAIAAREPVDFAFEYACVAIRLASLREHLTPQLLTRASVAQTAAAPATHTMSREDWDGAPTVSQLFGRETEAETLRSWILGDCCRLVLVTGLGGMGKTDLAACLGRGGNVIEGTSAALRAGIQGEFDMVMWRSLLNAPPPEALFDEIAQFLSQRQRGPLPPLPAQQIEAILERFQERRCLLILDNCEAVLRPGDQLMRYREGYEAYGAFFEQVARSTHRSCVLLTSREKPRAVADLEGVHRPVRSLLLRGIGTAESRSLFEQIGTFSGAETDWDRVVRLYNGNPLALEFAAHHIHEVFSGDLGAFLEIGSPLFANLADLLNWHLDRLSTEETELVYWMAIEREPVNVVTLYDDLVSPVSRQNTTSTLQTLQRRMPLERPGAGSFTLQPVLIEHVTARLVEETVAGLQRALARIAEAGGTSSPVSAAVFEALRLFNAYSLVKATAKENVRDSQRRLILAPVAERLRATYGSGVKEMAAVLLAALRQDRSAEFGYAAGNLVNLLAHLGIDTRGLDISRLPVWQACLHEVNLHSTDFSFCGFRHSTFKHPFGTVFSLCYSPDGESFAIGDDNGEIRLFRAATGHFDMRFVGHSDAVWAVAFSPDGHTLASASFDSTVRLWSIRDGRCVNVLLGHSGWVYALAFSPDGHTLASVSEDGTCRLWNLRTGAWTSPDVGEASYLESVAFSPDGKMLAVGGSSPVVSLFHLSDLDRPVRLEHGTRVRALAFSPDSRWLATGGEDRQVHLWRPGDGSRAVTFSGHADYITTLSFSAASDVLASGSVDHTVRLWSVARGECFGQIRVANARVWVVQCSPTDRTLATGSEDGAVRLWNMDTCECLMTLRGYSNKTWSLAFSPYRSLLLAGNDDGLVRAWNVREARAELELKGHASRVWAVAASADGRWAASASDDLSVRVWDLRSGVCRHVLVGHSDWVRAVAFDPVARLLASVAEDGRLIVWDVESGHRVSQVEVAMPRVLNTVAFCDEHRCVAVAGAANTAYLFLAQNGSRVGELEGHEGWVSSIVPLGARGATLASCSEDGTVKLWDLARQECTGTLEVGSKVWCGASCGGGELFVTGSDDGKLRRWVLDDRRCVSQAQSHQGPVWSLAVNPAEDTVATAGGDGGIRLWCLSDLTPYPALGTLRPARPYERMNITGATGLTSTQRESLLALGAISMPSIS